MFALKFGNGTQILYIYCTLVFQQKMLKFLTWLLIYNPVAHFYIPIIVFKLFCIYSCNGDYFHLYPQKSKLHPHGMDRCTTEYNEMEKYGNLAVEFKPQIILDAVKELFEQPGMKSSNSLLIINLNAHHARLLPFARYKEFIGNLTHLLKNRGKFFGSKARVIWRTATALTYTMKMDRLRTSKYLTSDVSKNIVLSVYASTILEFYNNVLRLKVRIEYRYRSKICYRVEILLHCLLSQRILLLFN